MNAKFRVALRLKLPTGILVDATFRSAIGGSTFDTGVRCMGDVIATVPAYDSRADSDEGAIVLAKAVDRVFAATLHTFQIGNTCHHARKFGAGTVGVLTRSEGKISAPFGGRDIGIHTHDQNTDPRTLWIDLTKRSCRKAVSCHR